MKSTFFVNRTKIKSASSAFIRVKTRNRIANNGLWKIFSSLKIFHPKGVSLSDFICNFVASAEELLLVCFVA